VDESSISTSNSDVIIIIILLGIHTQCQSASHTGAYHSLKVAIFHLSAFDLSLSLSTLVYIYHPVDAESSAVSMKKDDGNRSRSSWAAIIHPSQQDMTTEAPVLHRETHFSASSLIASVSRSTGSSC
jgi:hypothetical protein